MAEDQAFFTGSGNGQPKGISQESISNKQKAGASISMDDVLDLIDLTPQRVVQSPKAAFVGHRNLKRQLRKVKDSNEYNINIIDREVVIDMLSLASISY